MRGAAALHLLAPDEDDLDVVVAAASLSR